MIPTHVGEVEMCAIEEQVDATVPYYVPRLIAEIRHLRQHLMRAQNRIESSSGYSKCAALADAVGIIDAALTGKDGA